MQPVTASAMTKVESWIGALFSTLVCGGAVLCPIVVYHDPRTWPPVVLVAIPTLAAALADGWLLYHMWALIRRGEYPVAPAVAVKQPRYWALVRPLAACFWGAHLAFVLQATQVAFPSRYGSFEEAFASIVAPVLWSVGVSYCALTFLLLLAFAATCRKRHVEWLWRWRWLVAFLLGALSLIGAHSWRALAG